jgi:phosphoglycerate kinase
MRSLDELDVSGKRVLVRLDLNVPQDGTRITDDGKIRACLPTLTSLLDRGAAVIACSHLGRPAGAADPAFTLAPVAARLGELLGRPVTLAADTVGPSARAAAAALRPGQVLLLENLRFNRGETSKDDVERGAFADRLASLAQAYVGDGFGAVHRRHASVYDVASRLPHAAGYLMQAETAALQRLTEHVTRPYLVVLGGAKVADKLLVVGSLIETADQVAIGGAMAFTFLAAEGYGVGRSLAEGDPAIARDYLDKAGASGIELELPVDIVTAGRCGTDAAAEVVRASAIPSDKMGLDIGPETARLFAAVIARARTIFWNGPMGVFELSPFAAGTRAVAQALADSSAFTMIGGGDTAAAVRTLGFPDSAFGHVSTGGGASLEYLAGKMLPGLAALQDD